MSFSITPIHPSRLIYPFKCFLGPPCIWFSGCVRAPFFIHIESLARLFLACISQSWNHSLGAGIILSTLQIAIHFILIRTAVRFLRLICIICFPDMLGPKIIMRHPLWPCIRYILVNEGALPLSSRHLQSSERDRQGSNWL